MSVRDLLSRIEQHRGVYRSHFVGLRSSKPSCEFHEPVARGLVTTCAQAARTLREHSVQGNDEVVDPVANCCVLEQYLP